MAVCGDKLIVGTAGRKVLVSVIVIYSDFTSDLANDLANDLC